MYSPASLTVAPAWIFFCSFFWIFWQTDAVLSLTAGSIGGSALTCVGVACLLFTVCLAFLALPGIDSVARMVLPFR